MQLAEIGDQAPRIVHVPPFISTAGDKALAVAELAGVYLDPWQQWVLWNMLGKNELGKYAAFDAAICCPRQQGKSELIVARMLAGLFVLGEDLQIYTSNKFDSSTEIHRRLVNVIDNTPTLRERVKLNRGKVGTFSHGNEGVELRPEFGGGRVRFKARANGGGRGFSAHCLYLDEAMVLDDTFMGSIAFTLSARAEINLSGVQIIYAGSSVNEADPSHDGIVFARLRERALRGDDPSLFYAEWSVDRNEYLKTPGIADDPKYWKQANPALGLRLSLATVANERRSMAEAQFCVERLGIGLWPRTDGGVDRLITSDDWGSCFDPESKMVGPMSLAFDATPDHSRGCVAVAGKRRDGLDHVEVIKWERDVRWIPDYLAQLVAKFNIAHIVFDPMGAATSLLPDLQRLGVETTPISRAELAQSCGLFLDGVKDRILRHRGTDELTMAIDGVEITTAERGSWIWSRKNSASEVCPLYAASMALGASNQAKATPGVINLANVGAQPAPATEGVGPFNNRRVSLEEALTGW